MKRFQFYNLSVFILFLAWLCGINQALGGSSGSPFTVGEKMTFQINWVSIPAGEITIETLPQEIIDGQDCCHIRLTVSSNNFVDMFYKVRDQIDSYMDLKMTHSVLYTESRRGKRPKDVVINFDWVKQQAQYSRKGEREKSDPISIKPGTFDPLSAFLAFRLNDLNEKKEIIFPVTDGTKVAMGKVTIIRKETIRVKGTSYDTFLLEPELGDTGGVFEKNKDSAAQIWVTADDRRIPVRIKSQLPFGSFVAELTSYTDNTKTEK